MFRMHAVRVHLCFFLQLLGGSPGQGMERYGYCDLVPTVTCSTIKWGGPGALSHMNMTNDIFFQNEIVRFCVYNQLHVQCFVCMSLSTNYAW